MRKKRSQSYITRLLPKIAGVIFFGICVAYVLLQLQAYISVLPRMTVVIVGNPMYIVSMDAETAEGSILIIPDTTFIPATSGYGEYSLDGLWRLGEIEKDRSILSRSLTRAMGVPVDYYVTASTVDLSETASAILDELTYQKAIEGMFHGRVNNISFGEHAALHRLVSSLDSSRVPVIDLRNSSMLVVGKEADGSERTTLDTTRFDILLADAFEVSEIRRERKKVLIYNTTLTPGLGTEVARLVNHAGAHVVRVDNEDIELDTCRISASDDELGSSTVGYLLHVYGCETRVSPADGASDIELRVGRDIAETL